MSGVAIQLVVTRTSDVYVDYGLDMETVRTIEFFLRGKVDGVELTPRTIGLSQFNEFNQQVEAFISGSQRGRQNETHVEVAEGSYKLRITLAAAAALSLQPDLALMAREDALGEIDPKRAEVIAKWQAAARRDDGFEYEIKPDIVNLPRVNLTKMTDYRIGAVIPWVTVEKYLFGVIENMGGAQKANVHLRLRDTGQTVIVGAAQDILRDQPGNRVYREALLRVKAEQHFRTGQLRNIRLIAFEDYAPSYDEDALNPSFLFTHVSRCSSTLGLFVALQSRQRFISVFCGGKALFQSIPSRV